MKVLYDRVRRVKGKEAKFLGVIGGISKYLNPEMDPFILRFIYILLTIFSGGFIMVLLYFITALVLQVEKDETKEGI